MSASVAQAGPRHSADPTEDQAPDGRNRRGGLFLRLYTYVIIAWLSLPILVMILFGFNDTTSRFNFVWQGWTLHWYRNLFQIPDLTVALVNSLSEPRMFISGSISKMIS